MPNLSEGTASNPLGFVRSGDSKFRTNGLMSSFYIPTSGSGYGVIPAMPDGTVAVLLSVPSGTYYTVDGYTVPTSTVGHQLSGMADERVWPYVRFANQARFSASTSGSGFVTPLGV